jgi:hypothetical protein
MIAIAPAAVDDSYSKPAGTVISGNVLANDVGVGLQVTSHTAPSHGTATIAADGSFTYTPASGSSGIDTFAYGVEGAGGSANATVQIMITPVGADDAFTTAAGSALSGNVLSNDTGTGLHVTGNSSAAHGTATLASDGSLVYTPAAGFSGLDGFTYAVADNSGDGFADNVAVQIHVTPVAVADSFAAPATTLVTGNVLGNDAGSGLQVVGNTSAAHGSVALASDGSLVYTPAAGFSGLDGFSYGVQDSSGAVANALVQIHVTPVAVADSFDTPAAKPVSGNVLGNDVGSGLHVVASTPPSRGTANVAADGSFTYVPATGFFGTDSFQYTVQDASGQTASGSVTVSVAASVHPAPVNSPAALGLLASLMAWLGLRRRRRDT